MDFAQLYLHLGIRSDCTLHEFKQACRRRIRQQHPDRLAASEPGHPTLVPLAELLALYAKALRFHRRHGRLPGAAPATATAVAGIEAVRRVNVAVPRSQPIHSNAMPPARRTPLWAPLLILAATFIGITVANSWSTSESGNESTTASTGPDVAATSNAPRETTKSARQDETPASRNSRTWTAAPRLIKIGMDVETVRSIQGNPMHSEGSEWIYGPSWIRFERDRVIDWYSSPLHRLETETPSP